MPPEIRPGVIALWAAPRSRSTAFFASMLEHGKVLALHEPFCNIKDYSETAVDTSTDVPDTPSGRDRRVLLRAPPGHDDRGDRPGHAV